MNDITCDMKGQTKGLKSLMICDMRGQMKKGKKSIFLKRINTSSNVYYVQI